MITQAPTAWPALMTETASSVKIFTLTPGTPEPEEPGEPVAGVPHHGCGAGETGGCNGASGAAPGRSSRPKGQVDERCPLR